MSLWLGGARWRKPRALILDCIEQGSCQDRRAVVVLYGVSVAFACCAVLMSFGGGWGNGGALLIAVDYQPAAPNRDHPQVNRCIRDAK